MSATSQLVPIEETSAVPRVIGPGSIVKMFERLACDPNASVEKIERLVALFERGEAKKAEESFNAAMSEAQSLMRRVATDASNPQTHSRYASYAAIDRALRPIYTEQGFGLSFDTGDGAPVDYMRVLCYVSHRAGHSRTYHVDMPADGKGAKGGDVMTKTHAAGSAMSYGMRYLLKMIFNVAVGEDDDDGNGAAGKHKPIPPMPEGFAAWLTALESVAKNGTPELRAAWAASKREFCDYLSKYGNGKVEELKATARQVRAS